jgi:hypothetical protein
MPGDLKDPEQSIPYYYENRYDEAPNPFSPGAPDMDGYLRSIAEQCRGVRLSPGKLDELKEILVSKGYFHRNPGDETFRSEVSRQVKRLMMARKVAQRWLI